MIDTTSILHELSIVSAFLSRSLKLRPVPQLCGVWVGVRGSSARSFCSPLSLFLAGRADRHCHMRPPLLLLALPADAMNCTGRLRRPLSPTLVVIFAVISAVAAATVARPAAAVDHPAGEADPHAGEFDYYRDWGNEHLAPDHAPDGNDAGAKAVHDEYESFVAGVENVMGDQRAAASKRDVVDLGQSLHLLDTKFEHLKESLYEQMVTASARRGSKGKAAAVAEGQALAHKVKSKYTNVRAIARDVLDLMASNAQAVEHVSDTMTALEKVVGELQKNLEQHHKEMTEVRTAGAGSGLVFLYTGVLGGGWGAVGGRATSDGLPATTTCFAPHSRALRRELLWVVRGRPLYAVRTAHASWRGSVGYPHCLHEGHAVDGRGVCRSMRFPCCLHANGWSMNAGLCFCCGGASRCGHLTVTAVYVDTRQCNTSITVVVSILCASRMCSCLSFGMSYSWVTRLSGCMTAPTSSWKLMPLLRTQRCQPRRRRQRRWVHAPCHRRPRSIFCCWSRWRGSVGLRCSAGGVRGSSTPPNSTEPLFPPVCLAPLLRVVHGPHVPRETLCVLPSCLSERAHRGSSCARKLHSFYSCFRKPRSPGGRLGQGAKM